MSSSKNKTIPMLATPLIETHCHLDYLKQPDYIAQAQAQGIERIITIAVEAGNLQAARDLAEAHDIVYCSQGVHPHAAQEFDNEVDAKVRAGAIHKKVVAIGEIGLDYYYEHAPKAAQWRAFEAQCQIAVELDLPIIVHSRDADADTQALLQGFKGLRGVIHSFTSGIGLAEFCLAQGFSLGFNGIITFNKADNVRQVLAQTPIEQLLLETDAPYLTPAPFRGKENAPKYLPLVAHKVAEVKGLDVEYVATQTTKNAQRLFFAAHAMPSF